MHEIDSVLENETHKIHKDFEIQMDHLISARRIDLVLIYKKKITCHLVYFVLPTDQSENKRKWKERLILRPCKRTKHLWNMRTTVKPIVVCVLGTIPRVLEKNDRRNWKSEEKTTALLKSARILRRTREIWGNLLSLRLQWKIINWNWKLKTQGV